MLSIFVNDMVMCSLLFVAVFGVILGTVALVKGHRTNSMPETVLNSLLVAISGIVIFGYFLVSYSRNPLVELLNRIMTS